MNVIMRQQAGYYTCKANNGVSDATGSSDVFSTPVTVIVQCKSYLASVFLKVVHISATLALPFEEFQSAQRGLFDNCIYAHTRQSVI